MKRAMVRKRKQNMGHVLRNADSSVSSENRCCSGAKKGVPIFLKESSGHNFPHRRTIEQHLNLQIPGEACFDPESCNERGARAFTSGMITSFSDPSPPLHVAAHEAVHQLQHAGLTRDANLGAEGHAHHAASAITRGMSPRHLIGSSGKGVASAVRNYTAIKAEEQKEPFNDWDVSKGDALVADNGMAVVTKPSSHECYADAGLIEESNAKLKEGKKGVELDKGPKTISGIVPDVSYNADEEMVFKDKALHQVIPFFVESSDWLGKTRAPILMGRQTLPADCGVSAQELLGGKKTAPSGAYRDEGKKHITKSSFQPADYRGKLLANLGLGGTSAAALNTYRSMEPEQRKQFDKKHGLNRFAVPGVGEAFVTKPDPGKQAGDYQYHWGFVIILAGHDRVTIENLYASGVERNTEWYFNMYGPPTKAGQTWHDKWKHLGTAGQSMTMMARTVPTKELIKRYNETSGRVIRNRLWKREIMNRYLLVRVKVNSTEDYWGADEVYIKSGSKRTGAKSLNDGDRHDFLIPLYKFDPITGPYYIKVYDEDVIGDDLLVNMTWGAPYSEGTNDTTYDGADYDVTVRFYQ